MSIYVVVEMVESSDWDSDNNRFEYKEIGDVFGVFMDAESAAEFEATKTRGCLYGTSYETRKVEAP